MRNANREKVRFLWRAGIDASMKIKEKESGRIEVQRKRRKNLRAVNEIENFEVLKIRLTLSRLSIPLRDTLVIY